MRGGDATIMFMVKVLVAEDDTFLSSLLLRDLVAEHFEASAARDGVQATEITKSWNPDLILLDLLMPNKDGFEVLADLRADPKTEKTRVIVLSNLGQTETADRIKQFNIADYLIKAETTPRKVVEKVKALFP
jgi:DNA-binding response OmpR family regulator